MARLPSVSTVLGVLVVGFGAGVLLLALARYDPGSQPGQTWRRGLLSGEQIRLFDDRRYQRQHWSRIGADETFESGSWAQVGDMVSLVPGGGTRPAYLMRMTVDNDTRYLTEASRGQRRPSSADDRFERLR